MKVFENNPVWGGKRREQIFSSGSAASITSRKRSQTRRDEKHRNPLSSSPEVELEQTLEALRNELLSHNYKPRLITMFILRDPKTRRIGRSDFRDRIIHHALVQVIEPLFDKTFIYDSHANRRDKGTLTAIQRFDEFKRKANKNSQAINSRADDNDNG